MSTVKPYTVMVFKDDPIWDKYYKAWKLPSREWDRLFVVTWEFQYDKHGEINAITPDGKKIHSEKQALKYVIDKYPGQVVVG